MNYEEIEIKNPQFTENGMIDCEINHPKYGWIPFTASQDDVEEFGRQLYTEISEGLHGEIAPYVEPVKTEEQLADEIRSVRDTLLRQLDAVVTNPLRWGEFTEAQQEELAIYRQALLDVPQQEGFPSTVVWPDVPSTVG